MKKPLIALSFAVASALALADSAQYKLDWFKGIAGETETSISGLKVTNGSWTIPAESASIENEALVLDLDSEEEATFTIGGDNGDSGETGTEQTLTVSGVFTPITADGLLAGAKMNETKAQVGFAVVSGETTTGEGEDATTATTYTYYAWIGGKDGTAAIEDWVKLTDLGEASATESVELKIAINYWNADVKATFTIGEKSVEKTLTSTAATNKKIASVSCTGSGTLNALSGTYQYAVAKVVSADGAETKYATYDEAIKAGATDATLVGLKAASGGVTETLKDSSKEIATASDGTTVIQTKTSVLEGVKVGSGNDGAGKSLTVNDTFRTFLSKYCKTAYTQANVEAKDIKAALEEKNTDTQRPLWQSYVLGVAPSTALTLTQAAKDTAKDKITLALPIKPTGDFTVKCTVGSSEAQTLSGENPTVSVPLATGHYAVKITLD